MEKVDKKFDKKINEKMPAVHFDPESMIQYVLYFTRQAPYYLMNVKDTYPALVGDVPRIKDYITRVLGLFLTPDHEQEYDHKEVKLALPDGEQTRVLLDFYEKQGIASDSASITPVEDKEHATYSMALKVIPAIIPKHLGLSKEKQDKKIIKELLGNLALFGYSSEVFAQIKRALRDYKISESVFDEILNERERFLDVSSITELDDKGEWTGGLNNKLFLRRALDTTDGADKYQIPYMPADVFLSDRNAREKWLKDKRRIYVKPANQASGVDIEDFDLRDVTGVEYILQYLQELKHKSSEVEEFRIDQFIVENEARIPNEEFSLQFYVTSHRTKEGKKVVIALPLGVTRQVINDEHEHQGNIISFDPEFVYKIAPKQTLKEMLYIVKELAKKGNYEGYLSLDVMGKEGGDFQILEANARMTGATAPIIALAGLQRRFKEELGDKYLYVRSENTIELNEIMQQEVGEDMNKLLGLLKENDILWNKESKRGVIPYLAALPDKIGIMAFAFSEEEVNSLLEKCRALLI